MPDTVIPGDVRNDLYVTLVGAELTKVRNVEVTVNVCDENATIIPVIVPIMVPVILPVTVPLILPVKVPDITQIFTNNTTSISTTVNYRGIIDLIIEEL